MPESIEKNSTVLEILKDSGKLLPKTFLPTILCIFSLSLIVALFSIFFFPNIIWKISQLTPEIDNISQWINDNPNTPLTEDWSAIQTRYTALIMLNLVVNSGLLMFPLIGLLLFLTSKNYNLYIDDEESADTWLESIKAPFKSKNQTYTALFMLLFYPIILAIGIFMMYIPGFLFMIYCFFGFHSLILDGKHGREVLRGGTFYAKGNTGKIIVIIFIGVFLPLFLTYLYSEPLIPALGFDKETVKAWMNPENMNYGALFLYYLTNSFVQNLLYFLFPTLHTVAFHKFREKKLDELEQEMKNTLPSEEETVKKILIKRTDKFYNCRKCGKRIPVSAKKCYRCGMSYKIFVKKKE